MLLPDLAKALKRSEASRFSLGVLSREVSFLREMVEVLESSSWSVVGVDLKLLAIDLESSFLREGVGLVVDGLSSLTAWNLGAAAGGGMGRLPLRRRT